MECADLSLSSKLVRRLVDVVNVLDGLSNEL